MKKKVLKVILLLFVITNTARAQQGVSINTAGTPANTSAMLDVSSTSKGILIPRPYSDERIKDNIRDNVPGLSFISQLRPVTYNLNIHKQNALTAVSRGAASKNSTADVDFDGKYDIEKKTMTGFPAQDVEAAAKKAGYNFSGATPPSNGQQLYSLRYEEFVVPLVKAVQEQQTIIEKPQQEIKALKLKMK
jgi:hypothetical protein